MFYFTEFNGVPIRPINYANAIPRQFAQNRVGATGGEGEYDLEGQRNRMTSQTYTHEVTVASCDFQTKYDALLGSSRTRGVLKKSNGSKVRRTDPRTKIANITDATTIEDWRGGMQRIGLQFNAQPYWYDDALTTVSFTGVSSFRATNAGNARAIQYVTLTTTSTTGSPLTINTYAQGDAEFYDEGVYDEGIYDGTDLGNEDGQMVLGTITNTMVIDAGNSRITIGGVDAYSQITIPDTQMALLWLEPGVNEIVFNQNMTGTLTFRSAWV